MVVALVFQGKTLKIQEQKIQKKKQALEKITEAAHSGSTYEIDEIDYKALTPTVTNKIRKLRKKLDGKDL